MEERQSDERREANLRAAARLMTLFTRQVEILERTRRKAPHRPAEPATGVRRVRVNDWKQEIAAWPVPERAAWPGGGDEGTDDGSRAKGNGHAPRQPEGP